MAIEFKLPELGENIEAADVLNVLVKPGDTIEKDQGVIEIETDKATIEVPSTVEGIVKEVKVKSGDNVKVGAVLITVDESDSGNGSANETAGVDSNSGNAVAKEPAPSDVKVEMKKDSGKTESKPEVEKAPPAVKAVEGEKGILEFRLPELGENIESAGVIGVLVKVGDMISKDQGVLEIETDKATIEVPSTVSGKVTEVLIKEGDKATVGQVILKVESPLGASKPEKTAPAKAEEKKEAASSKQGTTEQFKGEPVSTKGEKETQPGEVDTQPPILKGSAPAAPSVRRIAREIGININKVPGSGPSGRISMDDVKAYAKRINEERENHPQGGIGIKQETLPDFSKYGKAERKPMSKIRTITAEHLSYAWVTIPHVTQFDKADITALEKFRKVQGPKVEKAGGKLTVTGILVKVVTAAMKKFPQFNTSVDMEKKEVIYKDYFNIGIAVDTENGLMVPNIKNTDKKNLTEISVEMNQLAEKARTRKISLDDLQGACFTITNLGGIGGTSFTPIVNSPEVAILGVSRGSYEPVYSNGVFEPRLMLPLSLSYDHRIVDGADAARFLRWVCEILEEPMKLWLD